MCCITRQKGTRNLLQSVLNQKTPLSNGLQICPCCTGSFLSSDHTTCYEKRLLIRSLVLLEVSSCFKGIVLLHCQHILAKDEQCLDATKQDPQITS
ncbi:hypothetical protein ILYODFUR_026389 [Ilyodon furcidens]|uniref:Uncharacterized protein n=1 Tax=Ilyodon furcidens TaxID=33524 RepID=A0ABV0TQL4_9TELE